jgi:hypothetical protein
VPYFVLILFCVKLCLVNIAVIAFSISLLTAMAVSLLTASLFSEVIIGSQSLKTCLELGMTQSELRLTCVPLLVAPSEKPLISYRFLPSLPCLPLSDWSLPQSQ